MDFTAFNMDVTTRQRQIMKCGCFIHTFDPTVITICVKFWLFVLRFDKPCVHVNVCAKCENVKESNAFMRRNLYKQ